MLYYFSIKRPDTTLDGFVGVSNSIWIVLAYFQFNRLKRFEKKNLNSLKLFLKNLKYNHHRFGFKLVFSNYNYGNAYVITSNTTWHIFADNNRTINKSTRIISLYDILYSWMCISFSLINDNLTSFSLYYCGFFLFLPNMPLNRPIYYKLNKLRNALKSILELKFACAITLSSPTHTYCNIY